MDPQPSSDLKQALTHARMRGDLRTQGVLARELALRYHKEANQYSSLSLTRAELLFEAENHLQMSASCFEKLGDVEQAYFSLGLKGAVEYDGSAFRIGINRMRRAIAVVKYQKAEVIELDLTIQFLMRARPESWLSLKRGLWLTRKDGPQADRRWEVVTAAIGDDIYHWVKGRRQRARAA